MTNNYYILRNWIHEAAHKLIGAEIVEVYTQRREEINLGLLGTTEFCLEISTQPDLQYVLIRERQTRKKRNSADLFPQACLKKVIGVKILPLDRVLMLELESRINLYIQLIGRQANVFLVDPKQTTIAAFKDPQKFVNVRWAPLPRSGSSRAAGLIPGFDKLSGQSQDAAGAFDKTLIAELKARGSSSGGVVEAMSQMESLMSTGRSFVYKKSGIPVAIAALPLTHLDDAEEEGFDSTNRALTVFVNHHLKNAHRIELLTEAQRGLKTASVKRERTLEKLRHDLEKARTYPDLELKGNLLTINIREIPRGASTISVQDIYAPDMPLISIPLDPRMSTADNIQRYFTRARKLKKGLPKIESRIFEVQSELEAIEGHRKRLTLHLPEETLEKLVEELRDSGLLPKLLSENRSTGSSSSTPFRSFDLGGNWTAYVGQNNAKNEMLTFEFATKHDYWFHARGVAGSHVVLKHSRGSTEPPKFVLEITASLAAYFSKAKTSGLVPVICTQRKYVRKIKGAEKGKVRVDREEVLIVPPGLPRSK